MMRNLVTLGIVGREVHEVNVVVVPSHLCYLRLCRCSLQEDVACHLVLHIDALCSGSTNLITGTINGIIWVYRITIFIIYCGSRSWIILLTAWMFAVGNPCSCCCSLY